MLKRVDPESKMPLYLQVKEFLKEEIESGVYQLGEAIPTETELSERFGISRATLRQAVTELVNEGLLDRQQGRGTFVSKPKLETKLYKFYSFSEDMSERGLHPASVLLEFEIVLPGPAIRDKLGLAENELAIKLVRLRLADDQIIMLETTFLPHRLFSDLTAEDVSKESLYTIMERDYKVKVERAIESFEPILVNDYSSRLLEVPKGSPALYLERVGLMNEGRCIEVSQSIVRGDRSKYVIELLR